MAPNLYGTSATLLLEASQRDVKGEKSKMEKPAMQKSVAPKAQSEPEQKMQIVWRNVIAFVYLHFAAITGFIMFFTSTKLYTALFVSLYGVTGAFGVTAGAHRLWAHRSYKANLPLRILLMLCQTIAFQNHIYEWCRDHRVHHKFTDTNADPHSSRRGFFFSHMGWLMIRKHPDVKTKGATIDMSDLDKDAVVVWQKRLYLILMPFLCFFLPTWLPYHFWGERFLNAWYSTMFRYTLSLHLTWLINSAAHMIGMKPFDKTISPTDDWTISFCSIGEGWHNYHHVFPYDYKAAELDNYSANLTLAILHMFAKIGWAYDLKTVPQETVRKRAERIGDGTWQQQNAHLYQNQQHEHEHYHEHNLDEAVWGWEDKDLTQAEKTEAKILNKSDFVKQYDNHSKGN